MSHVNEFLDGGPGPARSGDHPASVLIAEGDRACAWLERQPLPQGQDVSKSSYPTWKRYFREVPASADWPFEDADLASSVRGVVVYDAWTYLCDSMSDEHLWRPSPGDDVDD